MPKIVNRRLARWVVRHVFERGDFIETYSPARLEDYALDHPDRLHYVATSRFVLPLTLRRIGVGPDDVFIDVGSGKGRVVYQAARFPFKRVIGVEIAEEMNRVARYNIDHNRDRLACQDVELVTEDAVKYQFPDDLTVAYFYHPVEGPFFARVVDNLVASLDRNPRQLRIIYYHPKSFDYPDYLLETGRFELERKMKAPRPTWRHWHDVLLFRSKASAVAPAAWRPSSPKVTRELIGAR
jgi:Histone methylation protein DOT1